MADARVSVLIDLRSRLAGLEQAVGGVGKLVKGLAGLAAGYLSVRSIIAGSRDIIGLGAELNHLSAQTGIERAPPGFRHRGFLPVEAGYGCGDCHIVSCAV